MIVCNKTNREHENLRIIESITNHRVLYIDVFDPKYTNKEFSLGHGPFLCTMTDQFKKYLSDHNMIYISESPIERIYAITRFNLVRLYRFFKDKLRKKISRKLTGFVLPFCFLLSVSLTAL